MTTTACDGGCHAACNKSCWGIPDWDPAMMRNQQPRLGKCDCPCHLK